MASSPTKILFITGNAGKLREVKAILTASDPTAFDLQSQDLDLPEIQGTTREVAAAKVKAAAEAIGGPCITEVSGGWADFDPWRAVLQPWTSVQDCSGSSSWNSCALLITCLSAL